MVLYARDEGGVVLKKDVLTAMIPEPSYEKLNIKDGKGIFNISFNYKKNFNGDQESAIKDLLKYCWLDTFEEQILEKLKEYQ